MTTNKPELNVDFKELKKQYEDHASRCKEIAKEVNKWGQKTTQTLAFLKQAR